MATYKINTDANPAYLNIPDTSAATQDGVPVVFCDQSVSIQHIIVVDLWPGGFVGNTDGKQGWLMEFIAGAEDWSEGYLISDGYGGAHYILDCPTTGNYWYGGGSISMASFDIPPAYSASPLSYYAVGECKDASGVRWLVRWCNGIVIARMKLPDQTAVHSVPALGGNNSVAYFSGSDHSMISARFFGIRYFDTKWPYGDGTGFVAFTPPREFSSSVFDGTSAFVQANGLWLVGPAAASKSNVVADGSPGLNNNASSAIPRAAIVQSITAIGSANNLARNDLPGYQPGPSLEYVTGTPVDPTVITPSWPDRGLIPPAAPAGALVFDSFSRADKDLWHGIYNESYFNGTKQKTTSLLPGLGQTEGGSLGVLDWEYYVLDAINTNIAPWGIFNGRAVPLVSASAKSVACIESGLTDGDLRLEMGIVPSAAFQWSLLAGVWRVVDEGNFWILEMYKDYNVNLSYYVLGYYSGGGLNVVDSNSFDDSTWDGSMRVIYKGSNVTASLGGVGTIYSGAGGGAGPAGTKVGMLGSSDTTQRYDNFTLYVAP